MCGNCSPSGPKSSSMAGSLATAQKPSTVEPSSLATDARSWQERPTQRPSKRGTTMRNPWSSLFKIASVGTLSASLAASVEAAPAQQGGGGQRGGQRGGGQAARPMPPIPRYPDGTVNLGWVDPANK